jgi:hypothetical protein
LKESSGRRIQFNRGSFQSSLDHFVRSVQHRLRNGQTDLLCCLLINHQLEFGGLLHWQIRRLGTL